MKEAVDRISKIIEIISLFNEISSKGTQNIVLGRNMSYIVICISVL